MKTLISSVFCLLLLLLVSPSKAAAATHFNLEGVCEASNRAQLEACHSVSVNGTTYSLIEFLEWVKDYGWPTDDVDIDGSKLISINWKEIPCLYVWALVDLLEDTATDLAEQAEMADEAGYGLVADALYDMAIEYASEALRGRVYYGRECI